MSACTNDGTLGLEVAELSRAARARLAAPDTLDGAVVTAVFDDGPGARAGVRIDDVVVAIGGQGVANDCDAIVFGYGQSCGPVTLQVWRRTGGVTLTATPVASMPFLHERCERGDALSCFRLGWLAWSRSETPAERAAAIAIYERACEAGVGDACAYLGVALTGADQRDAQRQAFGRACELQSATGCAHLAYDHASGNGVPRDEALATTLYVKACDLGDAKGCYNVGLMYAEGRGVERDLARAARAYDEGCRNGSTMACTNLGWFVQHGTAGAIDEAAAIELYRRGCDGTRCEAPNLLGCVNLGRALRDGIGTARDPAGAARTFERVCDTDPGAAAGEPTQVGRACALLGGMHLAGSAPDADAARGRGLSERACERGDDFGCFNAATAHATGLGGPVDDARAYGYYERGCDLGDAESCFEQARRLEAGQGTTPDATRARAVMQKACTAGFAQACPAGAPR